MTIRPDLFAQGGARHFAFGEAVFLDPDRVTFEPLRRRDTGQPVRRHRGHAVRGRAQGLHVLEPVEGTDRGQNVGGIGALLATGFQQAALF